MNKISFTINKKKDEMSELNYVAIYAGKGNMDNSRIYIDAISFSFVEGLIRDKYREYGSSRKMKIFSDDIKRIVDGIVIANEKLISVETKDLNNILKFKLYPPSYPISYIADDVVKFREFLHQFKDCILDFSQKNKYVYIIREHI